MNLILRIFIFLSVSLQNFTNFIESPSFNFLWTKKYVQYARSPPTRLHYKNLTSSVEAHRPRTLLLCMPIWTAIIIIIYSGTQISVIWSRSIVVRTLVSESSNASSNLAGTFVSEPYPWSKEFCFLLRASHFFLIIFSQHFLMISKLLVWHIALSVNRFLNLKTFWFQDCPELLLVCLACPNILSLQWLQNNTPSMPVQIVQNNLWHALICPSVFSF